MTMLFKRRLPLCALICALAALIADAAALSLIRNLWRLAESIGGDGAAEIFRQLQNASIRPPLWTAIAFIAVAGTMLAFAFSREKKAVRIAAVILAVLLALIMTAATVCFTRVNSIPLYTAARIVSELAGAGVL